MSFFIKKNSLQYYLLVFLVIILISGTLVVLNGKFPVESNEKNDIDAQEVNINIEKELNFITHYVVGNDTVEKRVENFKSIEGIKKKYSSDWELTSINNNIVTLERYVEDLAPDLKKGAYFSLGSNGYLTLYQRDADEKNQKVIETFFRIDIEKLESALPKEPIDQLYEGIPIQDLAEYNSVISTFSEFSVE